MGRKGRFLSEKGHILLAARSKTGVVSDHSTHKCFAPRKISQAPKSSIYAVGVFLYLEGVFHSLMLILKDLLVACPVRGLRHGRFNPPPGSVPPPIGRRTGSSGRCSGG